MEIDIYSTWEELSDVVDRSGDDAVYVLIDVYKFSTTVIELLTNGASSVTPVAQPNALSHGEGDVLGGEYKQFQTRDIALYNSPTFVRENPSEYASEDVRFFSNNGARAVQAIPDTGTVLAGSTTNARAVSRYVRHSNPSRVVLVCAGTLGRPAYEDLLAASMIKHSITRGTTRSFVKDILRHAPSITTWFSPSETTTGNTKRDILHAARVNRSTVVPKLVDGRFVTE